MSDNVFGDNAEEIFDIARKINKEGAGSVDLPQVRDITSDQARTHSMAIMFAAPVETLESIIMMPVLEMLAREDFEAFEKMMEAYLHLYDHVKNHSDHPGPQIWEEYKSLRQGYTMFEATMDEIDSL